MEEKQFLDLIKNLQSIMKCPSCSAAYEVSEVQFLGSQDGYFLLSMTCTKCTLPVWVNFFAGNKGQGKLIANDLTIMDARLVALEPISKNEVIDFHMNLKEFNGDFKKALKK